MSEQMPGPGLPERRVVDGDDALRIAETKLDEFRARMIIAEADAERAQIEAARFRQADQARRNRPLWARLLAAWRGE